MSDGFPKGRNYWNARDIISPFTVKDTTAKIRTFLK